MELQEIIAQRYSVRSFDQRPIVPEALQGILEAACVAPTGCNRQPFELYVLEGAGALAKIRSLSRCVFDAPTVLLFALKEDEQWVNPLEEGYKAGVQDVSIAATYAMLAAWERGVGSCWVNYFSPSAVAAAFELPANQTPVLLMALGYPAEGCKPGPMHAPRKPVEELVTRL